MITQIPIKYTASPTDPVAIMAFQEWIAAGKPHGRDHEFWKRAEARVRETETSETKSRTHGWRTDRPLNTAKEALP